MAKGRRLTTSLSERFLGGYGYNHAQETGGGASELREDEVWSMVDESVNGDYNSPNGEWSSRASLESGESFSNYMTRRPPPARGDLRQIGGLSLGFDDDSSNTPSPRVVHQYRAQDSVAAGSPRGRHMATSAPVNVPDWSKIYRVSSVESLHDSDDGLDDNDSEVVPPHEYLARSQRMAANSVFEGVGRTLKGRDLRRVRDAVWSQTGFDG